MACGVAQSLPQLVAARVLQGLGGGGLMMLSQALIGELVPPRERIRFQGYFATVFTSASIGGPVLGGIVVSHVQLALAVLRQSAARRIRGVAAVPAAAAASSIRGARACATLPGIVLFFVGVVCALFWLTSVGHRFAWRSARAARCSRLRRTALAALVVREARHPAPFLPVELVLRERSPSVLSTVTLFASCMFAMVFFLPIYLQLGHHFSPRRRACCSCRSPPAWSPARSAPAASCRAAGGRAGCP